LTAEINFRFDAPEFGTVEQFLSELVTARHNFWADMEVRTPDSAVRIVEYESAAVIAKLFHLSIEYYHHTCTSDDSIEENACLIPICALQNIPSSQAIPRTSQQQESTSEDAVVNSNGKRVRNTHAEDSHNSLSMLNLSDAEQPQLKKHRESTDDVSISKDVDDALFILNSASFCLRHLADAYRWVNEVSSSLIQFDCDIGKCMHVELSIVTSLNIHYHSHASV
jgi:hypothetical protein